MTPDAAARDHRQRLLDALSECIERQGYSSTTVADIVAGAATSRRTFYEHFAGRDECLGALCRQITQRVALAITESIDPAASWDQQVLAALTAWGGAFGASPGAVLAWLREIPAMGSYAQSLQAEVLDALVAAWQEVTDSRAMRAAGVRPLSRTRAIVLLGGFNALAAASLDSGVSLAHSAAEAFQIALDLIGPGIERQGSPHRANATTRTHVQQKGDANVGS